MYFSHIPSIKLPRNQWQISCLISFLFTIVWIKMLSLSFLYCIQPSYAMISVYSDFIWAVVIASAFQNRNSRFQYYYLTYFIKTWNSQQYTFSKLLFFLMLSAWMVYRRKRQSLESGNLKLRLVYFCFCSQIKLIFT